MHRKATEDMRRNSAVNTSLNLIADEGLGATGELRTSTTLPTDDLVNGNWQLVEGGDPNNQSDWIYVEWWTVGSPVGSAPIKPF